MLLLSLIHTVGLALVLLFGLGLSFALFTSSASRLVPNRLSPGRKPPKKSIVGGLVGM